MNTPANYLLIEQKGMVQVLIHKEATSADTLQSFFHALVIASLAGKSKSLHAESRLWMDQHYSDFMTKVSLTPMTLSQMHLVRNNIRIT